MKKFLYLFFSLQYMYMAFRIFDESIKYSSLTSFFLLLNPNLVLINYVVSLIVSAMFYYGLKTSQKLGSVTKISKIALTASSLVILITSVFFRSVDLNSLAKLISNDLFSAVCIALSLIIGFGLNIYVFFKND